MLVLRLGGSLLSSEAVQSRLLALLLIALLSAALAGCGGSSSTSKSQTPLLADGTYVFHLAGTDYYATGQSTFPYFAAGAFTVSSGAIIQGEEDFADFDNGYSSLQIQPGNSSIAQTADGNLQIKIYTGSAGPGVSGTQTLNATLLSSSSARIAEFDGSATGTGSLDLQSSMAAPSGGYAFFADGLDARALPLAVGGVLNVDGSGSISGSGSVFDLNDGEDPTTSGGLGLQTSQLFSASTVSTPDAFGRITFTLNPANTGIGQIIFAGYIVNSTTIQIVESHDVLSGSMGGSVLSQSGTGGFSSGSVSGSTYVVGAQGENAGGMLQLAGALAFNADSGVTGTVSFNDLATQVATGIIGAGATYTVDPTGRVTISSLAATDPTSGNTYGPVTLQLYLDGNGNAFVISMDTGDATAGVAFQQTAGAALSGSYALTANGTASVTNQLTGITSLYPWGAVGQVSVGSGAATGFTDRNVLSNAQVVGIQTADVPLNGTASGTGGILSGTIFGLGYASTVNQYSYYVIDGNRAFAIETDVNQLSEGLAKRVAN
ncbi:MAG: hypothetical protein WAL71_02670 [Terriglobales bacterium]|jgi:hypothetical protein